MNTALSPDNPLRGRIAALAAVTLTLAAILVAASPAAGREPMRYVPFGTDFPTPAAATETFVPHVTDFPRPAAAPASLATSEDSDWISRVLREETIAVLAAALAASLLVMTTRYSAARA